MTTATKVRTDQANECFTDGRLPPMLVRASAGTGKTYRLTGRLLQILLQGAAVETVLATTFTRKAAGEILDRILLTLAQAADPDQPDALQRLRDQVGIASLPRATCSQLLKHLLANVHRVRICTLDSLFTQLAKSFPFELRLPPSWRLTDEIEEAWLQQRAVETVVSLLNPSELATLLAMLSKGDTKRSIARELVQVVSGTYSVGRLSPTEVWSALDAPTAPDSESLTAAAEALAAADPPQKSVQKKLTQIVEQLESRQFDALIGDTLIKNYAKARRSREPVKFGRSKLPAGLDQALGVLYAAVRSRGLALLAAQNQATGQILEHFNAQVTELKQSLRTLGFEDVAVRLADQFGRFDHNTLSQRMDGAINHLLLDEFQDTSPAQWQVLRPFAVRAADPPPSDGESAVARSFFCVGDTKQAIYGWRGGVAEIFDAVAEEIPQVKTIEQNTSYRSSPVIMDVVNRVFPNLTRHPIADAADHPDDTDRRWYEAVAVKTFAERFPEHRADKGSLAGYARMETCRDSEGGASDNALAAFQLAAERIAELHRAAEEKTIGVLTRTNKAVAQLIYLLERKGVDVSQEGGNPLIDSAAVDLVLSALMMSEHPADKRWKFHVDHSPLGENLKLSADRVRRHVSDHGIARTVLHLARVIAPVCNARDRFRLKQLAFLAVEYEPNASPRLADFVAMVRQKRVERPQASKVRVMTVHQSKGLEFDAVFLPELDGRLTSMPPQCVARSPRLSEPPTAVSRFLSGDAWHFLEPPWRKAFGKAAATSMTESLCLLYVAMTRARQALYLIAAPGKPSDKKPAALIHAALNVDSDLSQPDGVLYEHGIPNWYS